MRYATLTAIAFCLAAPSATAWTFTETEVCTLSHDDGQTQVSVVFDPASEVYSITLTMESRWEASPTFGIRFDGNQPLSIGTDRHELSNDKQSLSVADTGFGNVLAGIALNVQMTAINGSQSVTVSTIGAAEPMAAFRACPSASLS